MKKHPRWSFLAALAVWSLFAVAPAAAASLATMAETGRSAWDFAPDGWEVEAYWPCQLDGNAEPDLLVMVGELDVAGRDESLDLQRALVALLGAGGGTYRRVGLADMMLLCAECHGTMAGPDGGAPEVSFKKNVAIVNQLFGSRQVMNVTLRLRWEPETGRVRLIGHDNLLTDRATGKSVLLSANLLTGRQILDKSAYNQSTAQDIGVEHTESRVPVIPIYMEDIEIELISERPTAEDLNF